MAWIQRLLAQKDARLRPANQLVATAGDHVGPRGNRLGQGRFLFEAELSEIDERTGADVVDHRDAVVTAQADEVVQRHLGGEAHDPVIAGMHAEDGGRPLSDGSLVVAEVGLVGRAHFHQRSPGGGHDLGKAKRSADFHQLAPRDDHFFAGGQSVQGDDRGGGVVVDDRGGFRAGEQLQQFLDPLVPPGTLAANRINLQDRIAGQLVERSAARPAAATPPDPGRCGG